MIESRELGEDREMEAGFTAINPLKGREAWPEYLAAGQINIDRSYQRDAELVRVTQIARDWDDRGQGVVLVNRRDDGSLWVMDGQHRILAAVRRFGPDFMLRAEVYRGLTREGEAQVFAYANVWRRGVDSNRRYQALLIAGHQNMLDIVATLDDLGLHYHFGGDGRERTIGCWVSLEEVLRKGKGRRHLREVLSLILDCWGGARISLERQFVKGVSLLLLEHAHDPEWRREEAVNIFGRIPAMEISRDGRELRQGRTVGKLTAPKGIYRALLFAYNKGKRTHRLKERGRSG